MRKVMVLEHISLGGVIQAPAGQTKPQPIAPGGDLLGRATCLASEGDR